MQADGATLKHSYQSALSSLGAALDMPGLTCDEGGHCAIQAGDDLIVELQSVDGSLILSSVLAEFDREVLETWSASLLEANAFWAGTAGATLGVDSETGCIVLCRQLPMARLEGAHLLEEFATFLNTGIQWQQTLRFGESGQEPTDPSVLAQRV